MGIRYNIYIYIKMRSIANIFFRPSCQLFHGIAPQNLKSVYFTKTQKSKYLENKQNIFLHIRGYFIAKNSFVAEETFNTRNRKSNLKSILWTLCHVSLSNIYSGYLHFAALIMEAVKNVVRSADIYRSFYFIRYWGPCLSRENINLIWEITYIIFLANNASPIFPACKTREVIGFAFRVILRCYL